jgi:reverse transcriptase-like protein
MDKEIQMLEQARTWETVMHPPNKNIVSSKWVYRIKRKADGSIDKYKAHLVARGFTQIYGINYYNTYSPVAKLTSFRMILAMAVCHNWEIESFDFNGAYLNGTLSDNKEIYMKEPPGYETQGESSVKCLHKLLYGLKQAGHQWYEVLLITLINLSFWISTADLGVFYVKINQQTLILAVHVNDCILTGSSASHISEYKKKLNDQYALTNLGPVHWLLGIKIKHNRSACTILLSQSQYIDSIISCFSLTNAKAFGLLMIPGAMYSKANCPSDATEADKMAKVPYCEAIGSLMYASVATHPDISHAVSTLSQFLDNPGQSH